jgi:hypothetical protein
MLVAMAIGSCPATLQMGQPSLGSAKHDFPEGLTNGERRRGMDWSRARFVGRPDCGDRLSHTTCGLRNANSVIILMPVRAPRRRSGRD